jgi:hypothetical protein
MALKRAAIVETATPSAKKTKYPEVAHKGVAELVRLEGVFKEAKANLDLAKAEVSLAGAKTVIKHNCTAIDPVSSARLYEVIKNEETGEVSRSEVMVSFQDRYSQANPEAADALFEAMGKDVNDYVVETAAIKFDSSFFITADGEFNKKAFDAVNAAMAKVLEDLKKKKVVAETAVSPISCTAMVIPKPDFHKRRFKELTVDQNVAVMEVLKNTVSVKVS